MIGYVLTFLLCVGARCERVELPVGTLQACLLQAMPEAAKWQAELADKGIEATVSELRCTTERRA